MTREEKIALLERKRKIAMLEAKRQQASQPSVGAQAAPLDASGGVPSATPQGTPSVAPAASPAADDGTGWVENYNPAAEMPAPARFAAGYGGAIPDLVRGAKQIFTGEDNFEEEKTRRAAMEKLGLAGTLGNVAGNIAAAVPATMSASASVPAAMAVGAAEGGVMGALAPTAAEGQRESNIKWSAGIGGLAPGAGNVARKVVGEVDPALVHAKKILKEYGIKMSPGSTAPGALSTAMDSVTRHIPLVNATLKKGYDKKRGKASDALFDMLGTKTPTNNQELLDVIEAAGENIGKITKGKTADLSGIDNSIYSVLNEYGQLLPGQQSSTIGKLANDLLDISNSGQGLSGKAYQAIRSDLGAEAATATPSKAGALRGLQRALDEKFKDVLSPDELEKLAGAREKYRLANSLRSLDIKDGKIDLSKARTAVEKKARSGPVMPEARDLLQSVEDLIPKGASGLTPQGAFGAGMATMAPSVLIKALALGIPTKYALNSGAPQFLANNKTARAAMSRALRGSMQSNLSGE